MIVMTLVTIVMTRMMRMAAMATTVTGNLSASVGVLLGARPLRHHSGLPSYP